VPSTNTFLCGKCFSYKTTLWLAGGFAIAIGLFGPCFVAWCVPRYEYGSDDKSIIMLTAATAYASATFSGLMGGWYLQEYWYYGAIPNYKDVDLTNVKYVLSSYLRLDVGSCRKSCPLLFF
jgi:hypothetical protein